MCLMASLLNSAEPENGRNKCKMLNDSWFTGRQIFSVISQRFIVVMTLRGLNSV